MNIAFIKNYLINIIESSMNSFFIYQTLQSKIAILIGIFSILISASDGIKLNEIFLQFFTFQFISKNIDCMVIGNCNSKAWFTLIIPFFGLILSILFRFNYFKEKHIIKDKIDRINSINHNSNNHLFPINKNKNES